MVMEEDWNGKGGKDVVWINETNNNINKNWRNR